MNSNFCIHTASYKCQIYSPCIREMYHATTKRCYASTKSYILATMFWRSTPLVFLVFGSFWVFQISRSGQEMKLFLVWDSEGISERTDSIVEDLFEAADADTDDECCRPRKKDKKKRKKRSSSGSSESDKESSSDSESSEKVGLECFQKHVETSWNAGGFAVLIGCFQGNCKLFWQCPPYVSCFNHLLWKEKLGIGDFLNFSVFVGIKISALAMRGKRKRKVRSVVQRRVRKESHPRRRARRNVRSVWPGKRPSLRRRKHVNWRRRRRKCWTKQKRPLLWEVAVHGQWF